MARPLVHARLLCLLGGRMGFDIYGLAPSSDAGKYFRNNVWWWRPMRGLIILTCGDFLTVEEVRELGFNNGYGYSAEKAAAIARRLAEVAADDELLASYEKQIKEMLPESYESFWSKDNVLEFVQFLRNCGGFEVS